MAYDCFSLHVSWLIRHTASSLWFSADYLPSASTILADDIDTDAAIIIDIAAGRASIFPRRQQPYRDDAWLRALPATTRTAAITLSSHVISRPRQNTAHSPYHTSAYQ